MIQNLIRHLIPLLATSLIAGAILTVLSPYGTHEFPLLHRALFWIGLCLAGGCGAFGADMAANKLNYPIGKWKRALIQSIGATILVTVFLILISGLQGRTFGLGDLPLTIFYVWVISMVISGAGALATKDIAPSDDSRPAIIERLKPALRSAEIFALMAEDHYVRVYTSAGEDLILMRLSDAINEVAPLPGIQTHRSWWIAEAGAEKIEKSDRKMTITLKNGVIAPISRAQQKSVREAGWS